MRISVWQQFASNHSGGFEIVGAFATPQEAAQAVDTLRTILETIDQARTLTPVNEGAGELTKPELEFSRRYEVEWGNGSIDWIVRSPEGEITNLRQLDQYVFLSNLEGDNTWHMSVPFGAIVEKLGGEAIIAEEVGEFAWQVIVFEVACTAPDAETADLIYQQINTHLISVRENRNDYNAPWREFIRNVQFPEYESVYTGHIEQHETKLRLWNLTFGGGFVHVFPALLAYLEALGCTDVTYQIAGKDMDEVYETQE